MPIDTLTVTLNPTLDISTSLPRLIEHAKLRCAPEQEQVGGGGINVAHVIDSLGGACKAMLPVGGARGQDILQRLTDLGLECVTSTIAQSSRQCFTVYETETDHEYRFVLPGPTLVATELDACVAAILENLPTRFLVLSGSLPPGAPAAFYATVIKAVQHKAADLRIVVDTGGQPLAAALQAGVYLIKPSREEFCELIARQPEDITGYIDACRELITQGCTQVVALTLGAEGSIVVARDEAWRVAPLAVKISSTVGAGDSFVGGFVWSMTQRDDLAQAARFGAAAAWAALQTQGSLRFNASQIEQVSRAVEVWEVNT